MSKVWFRAIVVSAFLLAAAGVAWGQSSIKVASSAGMSYLTTPQGMTLYYFTRDANGKPSCTGACSKYWPPFHASDLSLPSGLSASAFGSVKQPNGTMQTTYDGWPLYTFAGDTQPGQMNGQDFKGLWFVASVPFYSVAEADSAKVGKYLVSATGNTLYYFTKDSADKSVCNGPCAKLWPPFDVSNLVLPQGLKSANFTTITRADGAQQIAYKGHPLYTFSGDRQRGEMIGYGFRKIWYTVDPSKISALAAADPSSSASSSSGSGW